jgi:hypothetical protein
LPSGTCETDIYFIPLSTGEKSGSVTLPVTYADGTTASFTSSLSGTGVAAPAMQVTPSSLMFIAEAAGSSDYNYLQSVTLTSTGNAPVSVSSVTVSNTDFTVTSNSCAQIPAGSSCNISVAFSPPATAAAGTETAVLTITDNAAGGPQKVNLTGTLVSSTQQLTLSQPSVAFGGQTTGTAGAPQVVYLVDMSSSYPCGGGAAPRIQINSITVGGTDLGDFTMSQNCGGTLGFTIAGRSACMITVGFAPGTNSTGARAANVTITPVGKSPLVIQLTGTGVAP